jgi:hypothetical protein
MPAPAPYRLYDPTRREVIDGYPGEAAARADADRLVTSGEYNRIEIQHLEDGLFGYDYYRTDSVESTIEW